MLLAIDTSTTITGVALYGPDGPRAECVWESGRNHSAQLLPQIEALLRQIGADRTDVAAVGVALGPGSWSGLRVGLSVAKGLCLAGDLPLIGVSTLEALAHQHSPASTPICPLIRLGRERFAVAEFRGRERVERRTPDRNLGLDEIVAAVRERTLFCGDLDEPTRAALRAGLAGKALFAGPAASLRRPAFLAELAWRRWQADDYDDLTTLEPIYLGEPVKPKLGQADRGAAG